MSRVCVHDKIIDVRMQKPGKISDKNCHIMAIPPSYAITQTLSLTSIEDGVLMVVAWFVDFILLRNILSTMGRGAHDLLVYIYWLVVWLYFFRGLCSGQLNPDTWLGRSSAFAGGIPSLC